ncbi:uncharacterized protein LOC119597889 [Penaeus monodon]|uniref:uncharacterized protein LOC119597889 n=1 Tax=Penaeus monodon TaxID=6687 RepID=UPI0018A784C7|nr:uncharacterized protein LOC119597889 [Penaeus monodon]
MSVGTVSFSRPSLSIRNSINAPILSDADMDGAPTLRKVSILALSVTIMLDALKEEYGLGRSFSDDQAGIYRSLEDRVSSLTGLDGRGCLLRFVCELQGFPIRDWTIAGEVIASVFTPREGKNELLQEYREAQWAGQQRGIPSSSACEAYALRCPFSVFNYFNPEGQLGLGAESLDNFL